MSERQPKFLVSLEIRLVVKAKTEQEATRKAAWWLAAAEDKYGQGDVRLRGQDFVCVTEEETASR